MRPGAILVSIVSLLLSLSAVVWLSDSFGKVDVETRFEKQPIADAPGTPRPSSDEGPQPTAEFAETKFDFGIMQLFGKGSHVFEVTNNGDAPLKLKAGKSSCQCTVGTVDTEEIAPGDSTTIEMSWEIKSSAELFEHSAVIHTNAPEHENGEVRLTVHGRVVAEASTLPPESLDMGTVDETRSESFYFYSRSHDEFELLSIDCPRDGITTEFAQLSVNDLDGLNDELTSEMPPEVLADQTAENMPLPPKFGYKVTVTVEPTIPVGFSEVPLTLHTDLPHTKEVSYLLRIRRTVPIQFFNLPGTGYIPSTSLVSTDEFDADKGKKMELLMLPTGLEGPFEVSVLSTQPEWLEASVSEEKSNSGVSRYRLTIAVPPGVPPVVFRSDNPAKVKLKTNHPDVEELNLNVTFLSR